MEKTNSGLAVASLILGILSIILGWLPFIGWLLCIVTIILSIVALVVIRRNKNLKGGWMAMVGIVLAMIPLAITFVFGMLIAMVGSSAKAPAQTTPTATVPGTPSNQAPPAAAPPAAPAIASTDWNDVKLLCDKENTGTDLQRQELVDTFKGKYVEWSGTVQSVRKSFGYILSVRHCPDTFTSDIDITMKDNQKDALLKLKEGDFVKYRARITGYNNLFGVSANDGELIG